MYLRRSWVVLSLLVLGVVVSATGAVGARPQQQDCIPLVTVERVDLTGDGRPESVLGIPDAYQGKGGYRSIIVRTNKGETLLDRTERMGFWRVLAAKVSGAPLPMLIIGSASGNSLELEAYVYDPKARDLARLTWDGDFTVLGKGVSVNPSTGELVLTHVAGEISYRYADGKLQAVSTRIGNQTLKPVQEALRIFRTVTVYVTTGLSEWSSGLKDLGILPTSLAEGPAPEYRGDFVSAYPGEKGYRVKAADVTALNARVLAIERVNNTTVHIHVVSKPGEYHLTGFPLDSFAHHTTVTASIMDPGGRVVAEEKVVVEKMKE